MRYWYIDFGLSTMFASEERKFVVWEGGPKDMPECWELDEKGEKQPNRPYDAFKADIWALGKLFERYFPSVRMSFHFGVSIADVCAEYTRTSASHLRHDIALA